MQFKTFVVKIGGSILKSRFPEEFRKDLKNLYMDNRVVLVHGGADIVTQVAETMGKQQKFIVSPDGMRSRYTDKETMEIYTMVMAGKINKQIVAALHQYNIKAIGLSGVDGFLLKATRKKKLVILDERGRKVAIDGGYTGKIESVNVELLNNLLNLGYIPVVAPIAMDDEYNILNVDSDRAAAYVAAALKADGMIICTDVEGLILDGSVVPRISVADAKEKISLIGHGMKKKIYAAVEALEAGVKSVFITSGLISNPLSLALNHRAGTLIVYE
ncbi:MAG: [LysW]-aminoadipate/[LysW]-glutamate kinase [Candidatus Bathyarchaeota archaeon]|nr:[LysW]-aminoadipate/[LysW]-glutamate kinase [Candidatus Bathyarchaeota archaeon]